MILIDDLKNRMESSRDQIKAPQMEAYMKNRFKFLGINAVKRKDIFRDWYKQNKEDISEDPLVLIYLLWEEPYREYQYQGMELIRKFLKKPALYQLSDLRHFVLDKSWWDTVDFLASHWMGQLLKTKTRSERNQITENFIDSNNLWLQRCSILFQLKYKTDTDFNLLIKVIDRLTQRNDFFIQKAIGWSLREYSKTDPRLVKRYVEKTPHLSNLAKREATRLISL